MSKKNNIIMINGKEYDAATGNLMIGGQPVPLPDDTQIAEQTKPAKAKPHKKPHEVAKNVAAHKPKQASTLMRRVVSKPSKGLKRSLKTQGPVDATLNADKPMIASKTSVKKVDSRLLGYAKKIHRSPLIQHFSSAAAQDLDQTTTPAPAEVSKPKNPPKLQPSKPTYSGKKKPQTTEELLEYALAHANSHEQKPPPKKSRNPLKRHKS